MTCGLFCPELNKDTWLLLQLQNEHSSEWRALLACILRENVAGLLSSRVLVLAQEMQVQAVSRLYESCHVLEQHCLTRGL